MTNSLTSFVREFAPLVEPSAVLDAGALRLSSLTASSSDLEALKHAYARTIDRIMYLALALVLLGTPIACGMRWFNIEVIAADREKETAQPEREEQDGEHKGVNV